MGITAMIPDMTIGQLKHEATKRWGEIWDPQATRMCIMLLCPRKERKMMELHGDMVDHGQPVMASFHRPRAEASLLEEQGFNTRLASFQFVDLATSDLGPWLQHLVTNEGWLRSSIQIASVPFSVGLPTQRPFETINTLYFRHPSLPALETYYLPFPPESLPGKCFVSLPRRAAAEMARQQAEVLGVGRLEKPKPEPVVQPEPKVEEKAEPVQEVPAEVEAPPTKTTAQDDIASVPLPPSATPQPAPVIAEEMTMPEVSAVTDSEEIATPKQVELPEPEPEEITQSELEIQLRAFFQELIDAGVEPSSFMDDPRWEELSERSLAEGLETWPILLEMTAMG
ncbi:MAG: hypothetical protein CMA65_03415 [Euryarchaeota archaeon]|nr:hypothetical protein [Euryarchaeota archaeon]